MKYYELTVTGEFKPLSEADFLKTAREVGYMYGDGYIAFMIIDGDRSTVILPYENIRRLNVSALNRYKIPRINTVF